MRESRVFAKYHGCVRSVLRSFYLTFLGTITVTMDASEGPPPPKRGRPSTGKNTAVGSRC